MTPKTKQKIQSLDRGLHILEYIAEQKQPVTLQELADLFDIEKSSAYRLAQTLLERGYVQQDSDTLGYVLDNKVFTLANSLAGQRNVQDFSRKYLKRLTRLTGETAHLAVRGKMGAVLVDHEFGPNPLAVTTCWGSTEPYHCTALGKALLAGIDKEELKEILGPGKLPRYTPVTVTKIDELLQQCGQADKEMIAFDNEEFREDMSCMASPVHDFRGQVVAAIGISGPSSRVVENKAELIEMVKQAAQLLSAELGYCATS